MKSMSFDTTELGKSGSAAAMPATRQEASAEVAVRGRGTWMGMVTF
jgi:hypothetical protein